MNPLPDPFAERVDPAIRCSDCAAVCCRLTVVLMPDDSIPAWLTDTDEFGLETMAKGRDGWCVAVDPDSRRCTIYERRPQLCRKFAMGGPYCRDERSTWFDDPAHARPIPITLL